MKITPIDIEQKQFRVRFRGFDMEEVAAFLEAVAEEMDLLIRENLNLKEEIKRMKEEAEALQEKEKVINETMISCQKIAADLKANAEREAKLIIERASMEAEKTLTEAQQKLALINEEILDAKKRKIQAETALKSMLESHLKMLELEMKQEE